MSSILSLQILSLEERVEELEAELQILEDRDDGSIHAADDIREVKEALEDLYADLERLLNLQRSKEVMYD